MIERLGEQPGLIVDAAVVADLDPVIAGSQTFSIMPPAIAASTALPPASRICTATLAANGWDVAHMPLVASASDRPGR